MTRSLPAGVVVAIVLALAAPAHAAKPTLSAKTPTSGDLTLVHAVFTTKGGSKTPKLTLTNKSKLDKQLLVVGGVKKLKKGKFLLSAAVLARKPPATNRLVAAASSAPAFKLSMPKGVTFSSFSSKTMLKNAASSTGTPKFCKGAPTAFDYAAKKALAGSLMNGYSAADHLGLGYRLRCGTATDDERDMLEGLQGKGYAGGQCNSPAECADQQNDEEDGESDGPTVNEGLQVSGTVTQDPGNPNVFSYSIQFTQPVSGYLVSVGGTSVDCPTQYGAWKAECDALGNSQSTQAGGVTFTCGDADFTYQFRCSGPRPDPGQPRSTVPAGTTITGRFRINYGTVKPGGVSVTGDDAKGAPGKPGTLSGP